MPGRYISNVNGRFYHAILVTKRHNGVVNIISESGTNGAAMSNIVDSLLQSFFKHECQTLAGYSLFDVRI